MLSPYQHELNSSGTDCAMDCPACAWVRLHQHELNREEYTMDEYARILQGQNDGIPCPHCGSLMGHYNVCPLINRQIGEVRLGTKFESILGNQANDAFYRPYKVRSNSGELLLTPDDVKLLAEMKIKA